jgi:hypothetical protein
MSTPPERIAVVPATLRVEIVPATSRVVVVPDDE